MLKEKIDIIHLNLAIALLCGLIVYVIGIETAADNEVANCFNICNIFISISIGRLYIRRLPFTLHFPDCFCMGIM